MLDRIIGSVGLLITRYTRGKRGFHDLPRRLPSERLHREVVEFAVMDCQCPAWGPYIIRNPLSSLAGTMAPSSGIVGLTIRHGGAKSPCRWGYDGDFCIHRLCTAQVCSCGNLFCAASATVRQCWYSYYVFISAFSCGVCMLGWLCGRLKRSHKDSSVQS